jgi:hypothetical protein
VPAARRFLEENIALKSEYALGTWMIYFALPNREAVTLWFLRCTPHCRRTVDELRATSGNRFNDFLWVDIVMSNPFSQLYFSGAGAGTLFGFFGILSRLEQICPHPTQWMNLT